jgi:hypothetical protein
MMANARQGYTDVKEAGWVKAITTPLKEVEQFGDIKFEAYILLATR